MKKRIILFLTGYFSLHAILIPKEILDHYKLTKSITWSQIQRELFGDCYGIEYYEYGDQKLLFVADPKWHRIVYADLHNLENPNEPHKWIRAFGDYGSGNGKFKGPRALSIDKDGKLYVADPYNNRIVKLGYDPTEGKLFFVKNIGENILKAPYDVKAYRDYLYIADMANDRGAIFTLDGDFVKSFGKGIFKQPFAIDKYKQYIYVYDIILNKIFIFEEQDDSINLIKEYAIEDTSAYITDISIDKNGNIYLVDRNLSRILKFSPFFEELLFTYGEYGFGASQFNHPKRMITSPMYDEVLITEAWTDNSGIRIFESKIRITNPTLSQTTIDNAEEPGVQISFKIDDAAKVTVKVYNMSNNNLIKTLIEDLPLSAGTHSESFLFWDGKDKYGNLVLPGLYKIKISAKDGYGNYDEVSLKIIIKGTIIEDYNISGNWKEQGEPYVILNNVNVYDSLIIEPGVKVMFGGDYYFSARKLKAIGNLTDTIKFLPYVKLKELSPSKSKRFILKFYGGKIQMRYFKIGYGGNYYYYGHDTTLIGIDRARLEIKDGFIINSKGKGISLYGGDSSGIFENIIFNANQGEGFYIDNAANYTLKNLKFYNHKNTYPLYINSKTPSFNSIYLDTTNRKNAIYFDHIYGPSRVELEKNIYAVKGISVESLLISAGAILKMDSAGSITSHTYLEISGEEEDTVYITSLKDDEIGGDTNGDADSTMPSPGDWRELRLPYNWEGNYSDINYFCIRYGGGIGNQMIAASNSSGDIRNCVIEKSASRGIYLDRSFYKIKNLLLKDNKKTGIYIWYCDSSILKNIRFSGHKDTFVMQIIGGNIPYLDSLFADGTNRMEGIELKTGNFQGNPRKLPGTIPYVITGAITFNDTIYIEPGVIIKFDSLMYFYLSAPLIAKGKSDSPIVFTSLKDDNIGGDTNGDSSLTFPSPGDWRYISISSDTSYLENVIIRYGGYGNYGELNINANAIVKNSIIEKSSSYGIRVRGGANYIYPLIENCEIKDNESYGIYSLFNGIPKIKNINFKGHKNTYLIKCEGKLAFIDSIFADTTNKKIGIQLDNCIIDDKCSGELKVKIPFVITTGFYSYDTLYIKPGVIIKVDSGVSINFRGPVFVEGIFSDSIHFTSLKDDNIGGDTNGDSSLTFPSYGDWRGIYLGTNAKKSIFKFFNVRYAETDISIGSGADSTKFFYGKVEKAKEYGYAFSNPAEIYFTTIKENKIGIGTPGGVYGNLRINFSEIYNNTEYGIKNTSYYLIDAEYNFWGDSTGPFHPDSNPYGAGNPVSDHVDFIPWLKFPPEYFYGKITHDTTWEGIILLTGDVIVDSFVNLEIKPGTKIFVLDKDMQNLGNEPERIEIIVYGKLLSMGTQNDSIIFDQLNGEKGKWAGIIIENNGSNFMYTKIKKASRGILIQNTQDIIIRNSKIEGNGLGIGMMNSQNILLNSLNISENISGISISGSQCVIESSLIYKNMYGNLKQILFSKEDTFYTDTLTGIYAYNSEISLKDNKIINNFTGLYATGFLNLFSKGNIIKNNIWHGYDMAVSNSSNLVFEINIFI